jgi:hypothetical protein
VPAIRLDRAHRQFQERLLNQFRARYSGWEFSAREDDFAVMAKKSSAEVAITLETIFAESSRPGASLPDEISRFVTAAGPRLSTAEQHPGRVGPGGPDPDALVWCVRAERSIRTYRRYPELASHELAGGLIAFVAEALPGDAMRGVSREDAAASGLSEADLIGHADHNTSLRLNRWQAELEAATDQQRWVFADDILFSSSLLLVPAFLERLVQLGEGKVALAAPDRALVVAGVGAAAAPEAMIPIVRRLYRLASFPLSPVLLTTDGQSVELHPAEAPPAGAKTGWLRIFRSAPE